MKMKPIALLLALALVCLALTACGSSAPKEKKPLAEAVPAAMNSMEGLVSMDAEDLEMFMDITADEYTEFVFYLGETGLTARRAVVVRAKDLAAAKSVIAKVQSYLEASRDEFRDYLPDQYQILAGAKVDTKGFTVALIVGEKGAEETARLLAGE